jgi:hypothetical protein
MKVASGLRASCRGWTARFRRLSSSELRTVAWASLALVVARLGARCSSVPVTRRALARLAPGSALPPARIAEVTAGVVQLLPGRTRCLPRAMALEALLQGAGHPAELRIGVAPRLGRPRLDAHAWVDLGGVAVAEDVSRYASLPLFGVR